MLVVFLDLQFLPIKFAVQSIYYMLAVWDMMIMIGTGSRSFSSSYVFKVYPILFINVKVI